MLMFDILHLQNTMSANLRGWKGGSILDTQELHQRKSNTLLDVWSVCMTFSGHDWARMPIVFTICVQHLRNAVISLHNSMHILSNITRWCKSNLPSTNLEKTGTALQHIPSKDLQRTYILHIPPYPTLRKKYLEIETRYVPSKVGPIPNPYHPWYIYIHLHTISHEHHPFM